MKQGLLGIEPRASGDQQQHQSTTLLSLSRQGRGGNRLCCSCGHCADKSAKQKRAEGGSNPHPLSRHNHPLPLHDESTSELLYAAKQKRTPSAHLLPATGRNRGGVSSVLRAKFNSGSWRGGSPHLHEPIPKPIYSRRALHRRVDGDQRLRRQRHARNEPTATVHGSTQEGGWRSTGLRTGR